MFGKRNPFEVQELKSKINELVKADVLTVEITNRNTLNIHMFLNEYLYSDLKETFKIVTDFIYKQNFHKITLQLDLPNNDCLITNGTSDDINTNVEIFEAVKSRLPSAKAVFVENGNLSFGINDLEFYSKTILKGALVLADHFSEELTKGTIISLDINNQLTIQFEFLWIHADVMSETIVNSVKFYEMMEFLKNNPHPQVNKFIFGFRDSNKGLYTELNMIYKNDVTSKEALTISNFIRGKLNEKFSHLAVY
jgi:hypothetical protein